MGQRLVLQDSHLFRCDGVEREELGLNRAGAVIITEELFHRLPGLVGIATGFLPFAQLPIELAPDASLPFIR